MNLYKYLVGEVLAHVVPDSSDVREKRDKAVPIIA